jgi:prevent-host-death family protein
MVSALVNLEQAKEQISSLLDRVRGGEEIVISDAGGPVARIVPIDRSRQPRRPGSAKGKVQIAPDFDAPLPDEIIDAFHASEIEPK